MEVVTYACMHDAWTNEGNIGRAFFSSGFSKVFFFLLLAGMTYQSSKEGTKIIRTGHGSSTVLFS